MIRLLILELKNTISFQKSIYIKFMMFENQEDHRRCQHMIHMRFNWVLR